MAELITICLLWIIWDIIDLVCIYRVMHVMFNMPKRKPRKRLIIYLIIYMCITIIHPVLRYSESRYILLLYLPYYLKATPVIYECLRGSSRGQVAVNVWMYEVLLNFIEETVLALLSKKYPEIIADSRLSEVSMISAYLCVSLAILVGTFVVEKLRKKTQVSLYFSSLSVKAYIFLSISMYCILMIEGIIFRIPVIDEPVVLAMKELCMFLVISFVCLVITLFSTSQKKLSIQKASDLLAKQLGNMTVYYEQMGKKDEEMRRFKHDSKNLLSGLYSLLEDNQVEQAMEYIKSMETVYQTNTCEFNTGNFIADSILSTKKQLADKFDIIFDFTGVIPTKEIEDTDMCIFLANALDNAIEACQKVEGKRYLQITSKIVNNMWMLTMSNPIKEEVEITNNIIETSKEDKRIHGYGLMNISRVVEKYFGNLKLSCGADEFMLKASFVIKKL